MKKKNLIREVLLRYNVGDTKPLLGYKLTLDQAEAKLKEIFLGYVDKEINKIKLDCYNDWGSKLDLEVRSSLDRASAQIKEIFLEYVGGDKFSNKYEIGQARFDEGYNQRGQEIRDKVMG